MNGKLNTQTMTRDEWLELRRRGIGGSDAAAIMGMNPILKYPGAKWRIAEWINPHAHERRGMLGWEGKTNEYTPYAR